MKGKNKKDAILYAAQETFGRYGYAGTTVKMISERAGVAFGLVSHYFGSKEELFVTAGVALVEDLMEYLNEEIRKAHSGIDGIQMFMKSYLSYTLQHRNTFPVLLRCSPFSDVQIDMDRTRISIKFQQLLNIIRECVERGIEDGSIRDLSIDDTTTIVYSNIVGTVRTRFLSPYDLPNLYEETTEFVVRSIKARD
ncbi:TetR/AcrR family transcriptional regulator [Maridesulfovibrio hydrothermalis]|uniref:Transcriptional regulator, TetR family n=1 Tax=Maridesulfovibrio hydrothermalis AM13 = DSM 14728 TaxID=1121451 RepID=L0R817_9BACT|nr:TetR/AcrR family transcriptional regulator [Maridesulfovibrio hydrothermalis]CCO22879.1 Transcriptional regulator, TetR family [Maridesulfovibrio hydrothermalis AM13 = DSM 14728]